MTRNEFIAQAAVSYENAWLQASFLSVALANALEGETKKFTVKTDETWCIASAVQMADQLEAAGVAPWEAQEED